MRDSSAARTEKHMIAAALLAWYDRNARDLPWRIGPARRLAGVRPDPYAVWLSEIMLQQTTVAAVGRYFRRFMALWPDVAALAAADDDRIMAEWAGLGYYARARNLLRCAREVSARFGGRFPDNEQTLRTLPGIGPYTAAAIAAIAFDRPAAVMDGNIERVMARLFSVQTPLPRAKPELAALAARLTPAERPGCHAQALMDLGATVCTPRNPSCTVCPVATFCAGFRGGLAATLPQRLAKPAKPARYGHVYVARRADGAWLVERRPPQGLLGGMLGWPGSAWGEAPAPAPPLDAQWQELDAEVRHTFTHFHLRLTLHVAMIAAGSEAEHGRFIPDAEFHSGALPSVMRKVFDLAAPQLATAGQTQEPRTGVDGSTSSGPIRSKD